MTTRNERQRDAQRKRQSRRSGRLVVIPPCADPDRRARLEADDVAWLMYYWGEGCGDPEPFTYEFTDQQRTMIADIAYAAEGGNAADAASRGEGKTTLFRRLLTKYVLQGTITFAVLLGANREAATDSLDAVKNGLETNKRLREDYPEVCVPIRALDNTPNRAHYLVVSGRRHDNGKPYFNHPARFTWCGNQVTLPNVPGSPSRGAIFATRGLDAEVRGLNKKGRRPDLAGIDDPDTEETVRSEEQRDKLIGRIEKAVGFLGKQTRRCGRVMLTTLQSNKCASAIFTDPAQKPSWRGKRYRFLIEPPIRSDLWDEFVALKQDDWRNGTNRAHELYVAKRKDMDRGAKVANPHRFGAGQLSALEHYYEEVADKGLEVVQTEYDNDPPQEEAAIESGITPTRIQRRLSGYEHRIVPNECQVLTRAADIRKTALHWVVRAWTSNATNYIVDYGVHETHGTTYGSDKGIEIAIFKAIVSLAEEWDAKPYYNLAGKKIDAAATLWDAGWQTDTVYQAVAKLGLGHWAAMGHGKSDGCATPNFRPCRKATRDRKPGDGWFLSRVTRQRGLWLVNMDADRWKAFEHARWLTDPGNPGAAYLYGTISDEERRYLETRLPADAKAHHGIARHLTSEVETEEVVRGRVIRRFKSKPGRVNNHYLDAAYMTCVAGAMQGIRLIGDAAAPPTTEAVAAAGGWFAAQDAQRRGER